MKKSLISLLIFVIVLFSLCYGLFYFKARIKDTASSLKEVPTSVDNISSPLGTTSNNTPSFKSTNNATAIASQIELAQSINLANNPSLTTLGPSYLSELNEIDIIPPSNISDNSTSLLNFNSTAYKNLLALNSSINTSIEGIIANGSFEAFNAQSNLWEKYLQSEALATNNPTDKSKTYVLIGKSRILFNIYNYMFDNGINPQFNSSFITDSLTNFTTNLNSNKITLTTTQKQFLATLKTSVNALLGKSNALVNQSASTGNLVSSYSKVSFLWNNYLDTLYDNLLEKSSMKSQLISSKSSWLDFKSNMINTESLAYTNSNALNLAKTKMNIRLTQMEVLNLLNYIPTT